MTPHFDYVDAPGCGGKVTGEWYKAPYYVVIRSEKQQVSKWGGMIENPYRQLQFGGVTIGLFGHNYWVSTDTYLGKLLDLLCRPLF